MNWAGSTRRQRLPSDWPKRVAAVKRRAQGRCEEQHHAVGCDGKGRDVDHKVQGDDHSLSNLQLLSGPCHDRKTRLDNGYVAAVRGPAEAHPGRVR
jgi:5-methylcytosine-specific restriction enzyme A